MRSEDSCSGLGVKGEVGRWISQVPEVRARAVVEIDAEIEREASRSEMDEIFTWVR